MMKMRRLLGIGLLGAVLGLSACSSDSAKDNSFEHIKEKGEFVVGLDDSFPPMGFRDEHRNIVGYDIDVAKAVADKLGLKVRFQPIDWSAKELELQSGSIDMIWNGFGYSEDRAEAMTMTKPYLVNKQVYMVKDNSPIKTLADLKGKSISLQAASTVSGLLAKNPELKAQFSEVVEVSNNLLAINSLKVDAVDAVLIGSVLSGYVARQDNTQTYRFIDANLEQEDYVIGLRKGELELKDVLETTIEELKAEGVIEQIHHKWFAQ